MRELGLDVGLIISQAINFGLLVGLLYVLLYRPVLAKLEERSRRIEKGVEDSERAERLMAEAALHYEGEMERARREAREAIESATRSAEEQRQEILGQAEEDARQLILRAREQAERETQEKQQERQIALHQEAIDLAIAAASRLLQEELDDEKHHELIRGFLSEVGELR